MMTGKRIWCLSSTHIYSGAGEAEGRDWGGEGVLEELRPSCCLTPTRGANRSITLSLIWGHNPGCCLRTLLISGFRPLRSFTCTPNLVTKGQGWGGGMTHFFVITWPSCTTSWHVPNSMKVGNHSQDCLQSQFQEHEMFPLLWEAHASWCRGTHPILSTGTVIAPSPCCHHRAKPLLEDTAPRPFMRPISFQASRSQEEHSTTLPA